MRVWAAVILALGLSVPGATEETVKEPPVVEVDFPYGEGTMLTQTWDVGFRALTPPRLSIAKRFYYRDEIAALGPGPVHGRATCLVDPFGRISPGMTGCLFVIAGKESEETTRFLKLLLNEQMIDWPSFGPISEKLQKKGVQREVVADFWLNLEPAPPVDIAQGESVSDQAILATPSTTQRQDYPSRAVRQGAQGRMKVICQVQADYSIICEMEAFDPIENGWLFRDAAARAGWYMIVNEQLSDGSSSVGKRFVRSIVFKLD